MHTPQPIHFATTYWENGSLYSKEFGDIYFSSHGGRRESTEVYLEGNNLGQRFSESSSFVIGELGFGTGLNFALTLELWRKQSKNNAGLFYISYEKHPLQVAQIESILRSQDIEPDLARQIIAKLPLPIESVHVIDFPKLRTRLILNYGEALEKLKETEANVDAWYLDGFSPSKNPGLWSHEVLKEVSRLSHSTTTASTYSVSGSVKNGLRDLNWQVEKVSGSGPKKELLRAGFISDRKIYANSSNPRVCVVGGGLSGATVANSFSRRGAEVTLFESRPGLAQAASGNELGIVLPYPSRARDLPSRFYAASFLYLNSVLNEFGIRRDGVLFQPLKDRDGGYFDDFSRYEFPQEFAQIVSPSDSSDLAGVKLLKTNLYYPMGGALSFPDLCAKLVEDSTVVRVGKAVTTIEKLKDDFDLVVIASGSNFELLPLRFQEFLYPLKGEVGLVSETAESKSLKLPVCDRGIVCPSKSGAHFIGSTYERGVSDELLSDTGEAELGKIFTGFFPGDIPRFESRRAAVRVTCRDRMPVVGDITGEFSGCRFFISTAHGSRGGVTTLMSAEVLAAEYFGEPTPVESRIRKMIGVERI